MPPPEAAAEVDGIFSSWARKSPEKTASALQKLKKCGPKVDKMRSKSIKIGVPEWKKIALAEKVAKGYQKGSKREPKSAPRSSQKVPKGRSKSVQRPLKKCPKAAQKVEKVEGKFFWGVLLLSKFPLENGTF